MASGFDYDVVLSFAGEDRSVVEPIAERLRARGIRVFYDAYETAQLWGKDLYVHLHGIYSSRARFCVIFLSQAYSEKVWTNHELRAAQERALTEKGGEYVLPIRIDDTAIAGIGPTLGYVRIEAGADAICRLVLEKLAQVREKASGSRRTSRPVALPGPAASLGKRWAAPATAVVALVLAAIFFFSRRASTTKGSAAESSKATQLFAEEPGDAKASLRVEISLSAPVEKQLAPFLADRASKVVTISVERHTTSGAAKDPEAIVAVHQAPDFSVGWEPFPFDINEPLSSFTFPATFSIAPNVPGRSIQLGEAHTVRAVIAIRDEWELRSILASGSAEVVPGQGEVKVIVDRIDSRGETTGFVPPIRFETSPPSALGPDDPKASQTQCVAGSASACAALGMAHYLGAKGLEQDVKRVGVLVARACELGDARGCHDKGVLLRTGAGNYQNPDESRAAFEKACGAGFAPSCGAMAALNQYGPKGDEEAAFRFAQRGCDLGDDASCTFLAHRMSGKRDKAGAKRAAELYARSCARGYGDACRELAAIEDDPALVERDPSRIVGLRQKACDAGDTVACRDLATAYRTGTKGVERDTQRAFELLVRACDRGLGIGCDELSRWEETGGDGVVTNQLAADLLAGEGCAWGGWESCGLLAGNYHRGLGVAKDLPRAVSFARHACRPDGGNVYACVVLGHSLCKGYGVPASTSRAGAILDSGGVCGWHSNQEQQGNILERFAWIKTTCEADLTLCSRKTQEVNK